VCWSIKSSQKGKARSSLTTLPPAPLPSEEDVIRTFFNLVDEGSITQALEMMSENMLPNEDTKQLWAAILNSFDSVKVLSIEKAGDWQREDNLHTYKVVFYLTLSKTKKVEGSMWEEGENTRFIILTKTADNQWKIYEIATGP